MSSPSQFRLLLEMVPKDIAGAAVLPPGEPIYAGWPLPYERPNDFVAYELEKLNSLKTAGVLSDAEFEEQKLKLLQRS